MNNVKVLQAGALTTIQDLGRAGYQKFGIPVTGVMDEYSFRLANILVGNDEGEAAIEVTMMGPELLFETDAVIAVTGADLSPQIDGRKMPMYRSVRVPGGSRLSFGAPRSGMRAYIAFSGKIDVPVVNGSKSTFIKSKIGGFEGRKLQEGDILPIIPGEGAEGMCIPKEYQTIIGADDAYRILPGPQDGAFTEAGRQAFFSEKGYVITGESDRMGIRFEGEKVEHIGKADIISDPTVIGSVQIPANGMPIILMADRQTTGGYTKIGTMIKEDIARLAQMRPGEKVRFIPVGIEEAQERYRAFYEKLAAAKAHRYRMKAEEGGTQKAAMLYAIAEYMSKGENTMKKFKIAIDGEEHIIEIEDISENQCGGATATCAGHPVTAPMAGGVLEIHVKEGDEVKAGQTLLIFEAMKMENEIKAPVAGKIAKVHVKVGDKLEAGAVFVDIL